MFNIFKIGKGNKILFIEGSENFLFLCKILLLPENSLTKKIVYDFFSQTFFFGVFFHHILVTCGVFTSNGAHSKYYCNQSARSKTDLFRLRSCRVFSAKFREKKENKKMQPLSENLKLSTEKRKKIVTRVKNS